MRRVFILFMIVLLPLRGWAGDLMGVQMATSGLSHHAASAMPADCPMHTQATQGTATPPDADTTPSPAGAEACTSCDLCIPMAELPSRGSEAIAFVAHASPPMAGVEFISASPAPLLKPPIS